MKKVKYFNVKITITVVDQNRFIGSKPFFCQKYIFSLGLFCPQSLMIKGKFLLWDRKCRCDQKKMRPRLQSRQDDNRWKWSSVACLPFLAKETLKRGRRDTNSAWHPTCVGQKSWRTRQTIRRQGKTATADSTKLTWRRCSTISRCPANTLLDFNEKSHFSTTLHVAI